MSEDHIAWLSETQLHDMFMQFPLALAVLDSDGKVRLLNQRFSDTFDGSCLKSDKLHKFLNDPYDHVRAPITLQCRGYAAPIFIRSVNIGDNTILVFENSSDVSYSTELAEMRNRIMELEKLSATDRLTGAWNRGHFDRTLSIELSRSVRYHQPVSLVLLDIDHFKAVNDTYGHAAGDEVLRELVKIASSSIRTSDMLFRWGGEEFVILAPSTSYRAAGRLAESLRTKVEQQEIPQVGRITISLGVAEHISGESETTWFHRADGMLYAAKNRGRNCIVIDPHGSSDVWAAEEGTAILRLNWHESYECGEPVIDREHRRLFELANALIDAAFGRIAKPQEFEAALDQLLAHVSKHFADEEALLAQHHYAKLDLHAQAHRRLLERAAQLRQGVVAGGITVGELVDFLADEVVAQHMLKADRDFYPLFTPPPAFAG